MFQENVFVLPQKVLLLNYLKMQLLLILLMSTTKIGDTAIGCDINGNKSELQTILRNGDRLRLLPLEINLHLYIGYLSKTGKARAAIRRYWHEKERKRKESKNKYYVMVSCRINRVN